MGLHEKNYRKKQLGYLPGYYHKT